MRTTNPSRGRRHFVAPVLGLIAICATACVAGTEGDIGASEEALARFEEVRTRIAAGAWHTCFLSLEGELYCWGLNSSGQLGDDSSGATAVATLIRTPEPFVQIAAGHEHTCGLTAGGSVYCWGSNRLGQCAVGSESETVRTPVRIHAEAQFRSIVAAANHTCGVTLTGDVFCWGDNSRGQVSQSADRRQHSPHFAGVDDAIQVVAGARHTCALRGDGSVECWGDGRRGQLGSSHKEFESHSWPEPVVDRDGARLENVVQLSAGFDFTCAARADGGLWCWGAGTHRAVDPFRSSDTPSATHAGSEQVMYVWGGTGQHHCFRTYSNNVVCMGRGAEGELGDGLGEEQGEEPDQHFVGQPDIRGVIQIATGTLHTCAIDHLEQVYCWGTNDMMQLGIDQGPGVYAYPEAVRGLPRDLGPGDALALGSRATCATRTDGQIYCWGSNRYGALGADLSIYSYPAPTNPVGVQRGAHSERRFREIALGNDFGCAMDTSPGSPVWCWGRNDRGQLGRANAPNQCTSCSWAEENWLGAPGYVSLAAGDAFACAAATTGEVRCWGANDRGQLGIGNYVDTAIPTETWGVFEARRVTAGRQHACALEPQFGMVSCWGENGAGQVGTGDFESVNWARRVEGNYVDVVAGAEHTCALDVEGSVWCWGSGRFGQLGDGSGVFNPGGGYRAQSTPLRIDQSRTGLAVAIAASERNTCLLNGSGEVFCWGDNELGQLGVGTSGATTGTSAPRDPVISERMGVIRQLRLGGRHACATNTAGETWCWGSDSNFQLGRGVTPDRHTGEPQRVGWP